jgi:hypothetical protein
MSTQEIVGGLIIFGLICVTIWAVTDTGWGG